MRRAAHLRFGTCFLDQNINFVGEHGVASALTMNRRSTLTNGGANSLGCCTPTVGISLLCYLNDEMSGTKPSHLPA
jgi:hypothetical protein